MLALLVILLSLLGVIAVAMGMQALRRLGVPTIVVYSLVAAFAISLAISGRINWRRRRD